MNADCYFWTGSSPQEAATAGSRYGDAHVLPKSRKLGTPVRDEPASQADPNQWVEKYGDGLYRFALLQVRKRETAEDLVQDTFLAALRCHEKFRGHSTERQWLIGILRHKICDYFRKFGRQISFTDLEFFSDEQGENFNGRGDWINRHGPVEWKPAGIEALKRAEFWRALKCALAHLPERIATVFMMREINDVPGSEICGLLNISETNLWVMLHRARMALRRELERNFFAGETTRSL